MLHQCTARSSAREEAACGTGVPTREVPGEGFRCVTPCPANGREDLQDHQPRDLRWDKST